jgi:uncharacterized protein YjbJ (UPF0337 family)
VKQIEIYGDGRISIPKRNYKRKRRKMEENRSHYRDSNDAPNSAARDRLAGDTTQAKGRVKESWGALTGNERLEAEGRRDQVAGGTRKKKGQWKDRIKTWIDRL